MASEKVVVRVKAFSGEGVRRNRCMVDADGTVRVWDSTAGYYTTCHTLGKSAQAKIRRLVRGK